MPQTISQCNLAYFLPAIKAVSNVLDNLRVQLAVVMLFASRNCPVLFAVVVVVAVSIPSQIVGGVITSVSVKVARLHVVGARSHESMEHKPVYVSVETPTLFPDLDSQISLSVIDGLQSPPISGVLPRSNAVNQRQADAKSLGDRTIGFCLYGYRRFQRVDLVDRHVSQVGKSRPDRPIVSNTVVREAFNLAVLDGSLALSHDSTFLNKGVLWLEPRTGCHPNAARSLYHGRLKFQGA